MAKNLTKAQERLLKLKQAEQNLNDQLISDAEELVDLGGKLTDIQRKHISDLKVEKTLRIEAVSLEKQLTKQSQSSNVKKSKTASLAKAQLDSLKKSLKTNDITTEQFKSQVTIIEEISSGRATSAEIQQTINDLGEDATEEMKAYLTQAKKTAKVQELSKELTSEMDSIFSGMGSKIKGFMTNPLTAAVAILLTFNAQQEAIADQFGAIGVTEFRIELAEASQEFVKLGYSSAEAQTTISSIANDFGMGVSHAAHMADEVADLAKSTATSVSDSATLVGLFTKTQGLTAEQAMNLSKSAVALANANDVAPDKVLNDVANNTEAFAKFAKDGGGNLLRAAIQAKKLGTNLGTVAGIMDNMLDFQSSIESEMNASIMIGRQLNYQKARELALNNDIEGAMSEIVSQLGDEEEFNKLNALQRKALASSIGVSVDQMAKFVSAEKEALTLSGALSTAASETIIPEKTLTATAQVINDLKSIGMELAESVGPAFNSILKFVSGITGFLSETKLLLPAIGVLLGAMITKSAVLFALQAGLTYAKGAAFLGPGILPALLAAPVVIGGLVGTMMNVASAKEGGITSQEGLVNVHPQEAIIPIEKLGEMIDSSMKPVKDEISMLRQEMKGYFGFGGTAVKGIGKSVVGGIEAAT